MKRATTIYLLLLVLVLAIGTLVRVSHYPHIPPGFNQDEAASAYEAFSLAETGSDKWGNVLPVYFPGWGSGQNVLQAYLSVPVIKLFGLNVFTARLVPLALGLLTLPLLFFGLRPLGRFPALLATFLLAVVPWHFMLSRWALESNLVPFFMLLGCVTVSRAFITRQRRWIIPSLIPFGMCLYAYGTTIVVLPPMLLGIAVLGFGQIRAQWKSWLLALGLLAVAATPFLLFFIENYVAQRNFGWTDSLFFATPLLPSTRMSQVAGSSWLDTVQQNLHFVAAGFDDGTSYNVLPDFTPLFGFTLPLAVIGLGVGIWKIVQRRGRAFASPRGIVLAVFAAWGIASLSLLFAFGLNVNRFNHFYLPCIVLAVWAITVITGSIKSTVFTQVIRSGVVAGIAVLGGLAANTYFATYPDGPIKTDFNDGLGDAFKIAGGLWNAGQVRITASMPLPYVYTLFYLKYPPAQFQREVNVTVENGNYSVKRFGKYVFADEELNQNQSYGYLSRRDEYPDTDSRKRLILYTNETWEVGMMTVKPNEGK